VIDADERALMEQTVRGALADAVAEGADADTVLAKLGWGELLADEPDDAIAIVFGALGRTNAVATALDDVLTAALGVEPRSDLAVVLPAFGGWSAPGSEADETGEIRADGLATLRAAHARELLVVCNANDALRAAAIPVESAEVRRIDGVDPDGGLHAIGVRALAVGSEAGTPLDAASWSRAVALGQRAIAHQIEGACRAMLDLARQHAVERQQFGGPIARFQAVRHRLAEALVAAESLEAALGAARDAPGPETAALAKAVAARSARTVARHAQQVLAGIGFTTEHAFHRILKRTLALEGLFGSADAIVLDVGRRLLAERRVPTLIEL
jgi:hypothetical protein